MSLLGQAKLGSSRILSEASYEAVAEEYYDQSLHPTCADFRSASRFALARMFKKQDPEGRIADIGCGLSLVREFTDEQQLVLVDASATMLAKNTLPVEKRLVDVQTEQFGVLEFDWVFAVLADPFNTKSAWLNISAALKPAGKCFFITPSNVWVRKFREISKEEKGSFARFVKGDSSEVFLPSFVYPVDSQITLMQSAGFEVVEYVGVTCADVRGIRSPKILQYLSDADPILDTYLAQKTTF